MPLLLPFHLLPVLGMISVGTRRRGKASAQSRASLLLLLAKVRDEVVEEDVLLEAEFLHGVLPPVLRPTRRHSFLGVPTDC
jgi:hypothetical protein